MDASDIGHPKLVDAIHSPVFGPVGRNPKVVIAYGNEDTFAFVRPAIALKSCITTDSLKS